MAKNSLTLCKKLPASTSAEAARELLRNIAFAVGESTGKKLVPAPALFDVWAHTLQDLSPEQIDAAGERLMKKWHYPSLPMPGDVRAQLDIEVTAAKNELELSAEQAWQKAHRFATEFWHPDIGVKKLWDAKNQTYREPKLSPVTREALKVAGGLLSLHDCPRDEVVWFKKKFIEHFILLHQTGKAEHIAEADRLLKTSGTERPQLVTATNDAGRQNETPTSPRELLRKMASDAAAAKSFGSYGSPAAMRPSPITLLEMPERSQIERICSDRAKTLDEYLKKHGLSLSPVTNPPSKTDPVSDAESSDASSDPQPNVSATEANA